MAETEVLPGESETEYRKLQARWVRILQSEGDIEITYAHEAARCKFFLQRLHRANRAILHRRMAESDRQSRASRAQEIAELAARLVTSPAEVVAKLRDTSEGCSYLITQWKMLARELSAEARSGSSKLNGQ